MLGTFLVAQWLGLRASTTGGVGSIPGWGTLPHSEKGGKKKIGSIYIVWKHNFLWDTMISFPPFPFYDRFSVLVLDL